jgi:hypothetical protein
MAEFFLIFGSMIIQTKDLEISQHLEPIQTSDFQVVGCTKNDGCSPTPREK